MAFKLGGYTNARLAPVKNRTGKASAGPLHSNNAALTPAATHAPINIKRRGRTRSGRFSTADNKHPATNPNCTEIVIHAPTAADKCHSVRNCGRTADAENHAPMLNTEDAVSATRARHLPGGSTSSCRMGFISGFETARAARHLSASKLVLSTMNCKLSTLFEGPRMIPCSPKDLRCRMSPKFPRRAFLTLTAGALTAPRFSWGAVEVPAILDHILLGCHDLDSGISFVEQHTGVRASFGGVHPGRGTRNALLSLGEKHYLEIIAPDPAQSGVPDRLGLQKLTEPRLVGWAAHPGNLDQFASRLHAANLGFDGPTPGSRNRPDGRLLEWKTLNLHDDLGGLLPFFIEWSADTTHPSADAPSGCKIVRFSLSTPNDSHLRQICAVLGLDVPVEHAEKPQLDARIAGLSGKVMTLTS